MGSPSYKLVKTIYWESTSWIYWELPLLYYCSFLLVLVGWWICLFYVYTVPFHPFSSFFWNLGSLQGLGRIRQTTCPRRGSRHQSPADSLWALSSKQYVLYLAKKNAIKTWTSDGPDGKNRGCLEVQIAIATEKIRNMILHMREFRKDYRCRLKLTSLVCARRRMLDKLPSKNLDSYMKIREELKIRHVYRIEALKNRLGAYMYPIKDRSDLKLTIEGPPPGICCLSSWDTGPPG